MNVQVAFLTGQSDPRSCALSPVQSAFLDELPLPANAKVSLNFPYRDDLRAYRATPLLRASINNATQFVGSQLPQFRVLHRRRAIALIERADRTLFLTGSCGLEIFNNLAFPSELNERVTIVAYGPVARRRPYCAHVTIGSRRDPLSRAIFSDPDILIDEGHLDYLSSPVVYATCCERIASLLAGNDA